MNTHTTIHRGTVTGWTLGVSSVLASGLVATLVTATAVASSAVPARPDDEVGQSSSHGAPISTKCFIGTLDWNTSLEGPRPVCYRYLP